MALSGAPDITPLYRESRTAIASAGGCREGCYTRSACDVTVDRAAAATQVEADPKQLHQLFDGRDVVHAGHGAQLPAFISPPGERRRRPAYAGHRHRALRSLRAVSHTVGERLTELGTLRVTSDELVD